MKQQPLVAMRLLDRSISSAAKMRRCIITNHYRLLSSVPTTTTPSESSEPSTTATVPPKFYRSRKERTSVDDIYEFDHFYDKRIKRRRRIDPTRELNYTTQHWERHKSPYRRIKFMMTTFGSSPFQRLLFPDMFITSLIAGGLTYYNEIIATDAASQLLTESGGFAGATTAVALLTGFRLNASYGRYKDGRKLLSDVNTASRDLASNTMMWIVKKQDRDRMLLLIKAFSVSMTFHLNKKGNHVSIRRCDANFDEQIYAEFYAEMLDVFQDEANSNFIKVCNWYRKKSHVPLGITTLMRGIIATNIDQKDALNRELDIQVGRLVKCVGGCETIQKTPIPTCLTRHTSRLLFVWSNMMPFAIYSSCGPFFTLPATIAISYSIMGIEDIGVQLEEPFNILPLRQLGEGIIGGVDFIESSYLESNSDDLTSDSNSWEKGIL